VDDDDQHLRDKAKLLLQRERELFELRQKQERTAVWLSIGQALPLLFQRGTGLAQEVWDRVRKLLVSKLRLQRVLVFELHEEALRAVAPAGPDRALPAGARALLGTQASGRCNDPPAETEPGVAELAQTLGLHRFLWSVVARSGGVPLLITGGFDPAKAVFQPPFESSDSAHFGNTARHVESLLGNLLLIDELEREKEQLRQANSTLEHRDLELQQAAAQLRAANETLEQRVQERTQELARRNEELRLVLDNVDQALLTVDLDGRLAPGRSSAVDRWFGPYLGAPRFHDHVQADQRFSQLFELGLDALRDDFLPRVICLEQMPKRLIVGERHFGCRYLPIEEGEQLQALLLVIDDVTERLTRAREDAAQRELLAAFTALMRDRHGFLAFFNDTEQLLERLSAPDTDAATQKRLLHTLKGNTGIFGLRVIAELCHAAEEELANDQAVRSETFEQLRVRWGVVAQTLRAVMPEQQRTVELSRPELSRLSALAERGASATEVVAELQRLWSEPLERPLQRLAQHAEALAVRLSKGHLDIEIDAAGVRLEPERWAPLWSALIHIVRNAVDHGLENPEERLRLGKSERGRLRFLARQEGHGYRLEIVDDGRGIDWNSVQRLCEAQARPVHTRRELAQALLSPGFSTRGEVTETSGRGWGLAAVDSVVRELGGTLDVDTESAGGTRWTLTFPEARTYESRFS
jgi:HPt (histidine-containing phosphotransfer) domain-containing protein